MTKLHGYTLAELANMQYNVQPTEELKEIFIERTKNHIALVNEFAAKIDRSFPNHDASKLSTLLDAYCFFSKPKEERTEEENTVLDIATYIHITQSPHHPEYWTDTDLSGFTRENCNPNGIIDASDMPNEYIEEMVADWCAVGKEKNNTAMEWFDRVNGIRWYFTPEQQKFIKLTIRSIEC